MSAQALGIDLLGEVRVEGLDELLQSLRTLEQISKPKLGLPALDRLLDVYQNPHQKQPQKNTQLPTVHHSVQRQNLGNKSKPPVIEITAAWPCSGKTQLLYQITALSILPSTHGQHQIRGRDEAAVVLDLDNKFSVLRLGQILSLHLSSLKIPTQEVDISSLVEASLRHLHIFQPHSMRSLIATVNSLFTYFNNTRSHCSANRVVGLLVLNGLSAFLLQDRLDADEADLVGANNGRENHGVLAQSYRDLVDAVRRVQQTFECMIIGTNWGLAPVQYNAGHPALRPHLPAIWTSFCTLRLVVERNTISKFGPGMSAGEAMKEGLQRQEAVDEGGFSCWVNWWGSDGWREDVREAVHGVKKGVVMWFRIKDGKVVIDDGRNTSNSTIDFTHIST